MRTIVCIIGKSGAGKDTVLNSIIDKEYDRIRPVVTYTTRPKRANECNGREYNFVSQDDFNKMKAENKVIESRTYHTIKGDWTYFTCESCFADNFCNLMIATPEAVDKLYDYFDADEINVIYLTLDDKKRLLRCIERESVQKCPDYREICRRYLADDKDFCEEKIDQYRHLFRVDTDCSVEDIAKRITDIIKSI